jgi:hypothetical protein
MQPAKRLWTPACLGALAIVIAGACHAIAGQQKWASQYVQWKSDGQVTEVLNLDQQVWIAKTGDGSYWPMQFGFNNVGNGGYMGLQQTKANDQRARVSIWNATAAEGSSCKPFDNEGVGQTCILPMKIESGKFYRLRLSRLESTPDGQWWGGWLIEVGRNGALVEHRIGRIKAPAAAKSVNPKAIRNFVEYYGPSLAACDRVPLSIVGFSPPAMNYNGKGTGVYQGYTSYAGSKQASGNICASGKEDKGAAITATPYSFGSAGGVVMFLGGTPSEHMLDSKKHPPPPPMPNG